MAIRTARCIALATSSIVLAAGGSYAATGTDDQADEVLEGIVVTAQKRAQKLEDVPMSVSAVSGDAIDQGPRNIQEILRSVPGVSFSGTEPGQGRYTIRGISTGASSPTTGIYLDDVSLVSINTGFAGAIDPPLFDLERIEVLKGPQGTLYGGSAMGGAIKYVSRAPSLDAASVTAAAELASTAGGAISYEGQSVVNLPLEKDKMGVRLGVMYRDDGGYIDYVPNATGVFVNHSLNNPPLPYEPLPFASAGTLSIRDANERRNFAARIAGKWLASDSLTVTPVVTIQRSNKLNPDDYWGNLPDFQASYRSRQPTHDDVDIYSLNLNQSFSRVDFTSLTAYTSRKIRWSRDYTYFIAGLVPFLISSDSPNESDTSTFTFSQEFRLASADANASTKWVVGAFYARQADELYQIVHTSDAGVIFGTGTDVTYEGDQRTRSTQYAVFADITRTVADRLDLNAGVRWFEIKQTVNGVFDGVFNGGHSEINDKKATNAGFNPKVSISYRLQPGYLLYASASKGFRPGGPNRFDTSSPLCAPDFERLGISRAPNSYGPDSLWTYELGSKNVVAGGRFVANAALFYTDWKKIQQQVDLPTCGFQFIANVGAATVKGAELSLEGALPAGLKLGGNVTYTQGRITESAPGVSAAEGQPMLDTPKWMGNVFGEYRIPGLERVAGTLRAEYKYRGSSIRAFDTVATVANPDGSLSQIADPSQVQQAYRILNAEFNLAWEKWQARLYVTNLTNASPVLDDTSRVNLFLTQTTLRPRTIGIGVRATF